MQANRFSVTEETVGAYVTLDERGYLQKRQSQKQSPGLSFNHQSYVWHPDSRCFHKSCGILKETPVFYES